VLTFDREFTSQDQVDAISERVNESHVGPSNARRIKVVGSNAKYTRMALTPVEMDFAESRKSNREAIAMAFGVPVVYLGDTEASTYSNFQSSELIFYVQTVIPILEDMKDAYNFSFKDELRPGEHLTYDISNIPAMREALWTKVQTAKTLHQMGVPVEELNRLFEFGIEEYDGWAESHVTGGQTQTEELRTDVKKKPLRLVRDVLRPKMLNSRIG
jgi:HK97 family phage portal protein